MHDRHSQCHAVLFHPAFFILPLHLSRFLHARNSMENASCDACNAETSATSCAAMLAASGVSDPSLEDSLLSKLKLLDLHRQLSLERCSRFIEEMEAAMRRMEVGRVARYATQSSSRSLESQEVGTNRLSDAGSMCPLSLYGNGTRTTPGTGRSKQRRSRSRLFCSAAHAGELESFIVSSTISCAPRQRSLSASPSPLHTGGVCEERQRSRREQHRRQKMQWRREQRSCCSTRA